MDTYQAFRDFLDDRGYAKEFDQAFYNAHPGYRLDDNLWEVLGGDECFLGRAFDWERTPQGRSFWAKVDCEWYTLYLAQ